MKEMLLKQNNQLYQAKHSNLKTALTFAIFTDYSFQ